MSAQTSTAWPFQRDAVENWAYHGDVFTAEECKRIIEIGNTQELSAGLIFGGVENLKARDCSVSFIQPEVDTGWIYDRLSGCIAALNTQFFNFELYGLIEKLQFTKYEAPTGHYTAHVDKQFNQYARKLSVTVQLSNEEDYDGGELKLHYSSKPITTLRTQGMLTVFPSYVLHEVMPVTRGTRYSLVCWVTGPSFK